MRAPTLVQGEAFGVEFLNRGSGVPGEQKHVPVLIPHDDSRQLSSTCGEVSRGESMEQHGEEFFVKNTVELFPVAIPKSTHTVLGAGANG